MLEEPADLAGLADVRRDHHHSRDRLFSSHASALQPDATRIVRQVLVGSEEDWDGLGRFVALKAALLARNVDESDESIEVGADVAGEVVLTTFEDGAIWTLHLTAASDDLDVGAVLAVLAVLAMKQVLAGKSAGDEGVQYEHGVDAGVREELDDLESDNLSLWESLLEFPWVLSAFTFLSYDTERHLPRVVLAVETSAAVVVDDH